MNQDVSAWINDFDRTLALKGYRLLTFSYEWDQGWTYYVVRWDPPSVCPWLPEPRTEMNRMQGQDPERLLALVTQLPYNHLN